ncbi:MAG: hypothetical protein DWQ43_10775 [Acidobacteria bacterium]|nr:MAG: hypothetical protein DWQ32_05085 [Acidobacteriota bacterium]REK14068.1 MAG: hypothetical protein DWQ43_10775 [Acidobacteriota bacterium]
MIWGNVLNLFLGIICLLAGILLVKFRGPLGKAADAYDAKLESILIPKFLRLPRASGSERALIFGLFLIAGALYGLYLAIFD